MVNKDYPMERMNVPKKIAGPKFIPLKKRIRGFANAAEFEGFESGRDEDDRTPMRRGFIPTPHRNPFSVRLWR